MATKTTQFTVTGRGHFPADMLRYDACWPSTTGDAITMMQESTEPGVTWKQPERTVRLRTERSGSPTIGRWASFGWHVGDPTRQ